MSRVAWMLLVAAAAALLGACGSGSSAPYPEDERVSNANYFQEPEAYRTALLSDPWLRSIRVGGSTFGVEIPRIVRVDIDGVGRLQDRDITLQTAPTVELFSGPTEQRMKEFMHGALSLVDSREGHMRGLAITTSRATFEAAAISPIIEEHAIDGDLTLADRRIVSSMLSEYAREAASHSLAWYDTRSSWITIGAEIGRTVRASALKPRSVSPQRGIFAAYVLRHEFEHAVTTPSIDGDEQLLWIEEGGADALATWPGAAAETAKALGLPYPKRFETRRYSSPRAGYPEWRTAVLLLLRAGGVDPASPKAFDLADEILQEGPLAEAPRRIADAITIEQGLTQERRERLPREIVRLRGDVAATRRLVRAWT